jgi:hypothetical protein
VLRACCWRNFERYEVEHVAFVLQGRIFVSCIIESERYRRSTSGLKPALFLAFGGAAGSLALSKLIL